MRPLTWALKEVDPIGLHRQSGITWSGNLVIVKILKLHHIRKKIYRNFFQEDGFPWPTGPYAPKHNGKSGTGQNLSHISIVMVHFGSKNKNCIGVFWYTLYH
jgi:hypothetical protein